MTYSQEDWETIVQAYLAIVGLASIIVKLIPVLPADSKWLPLVKAIAKIAALNKSVDNKKRPK